MRIVVCGAGGFIGWHLVNALKAEGHYVVGLDKKHPEFEKHRADVFNLVDLREYARMQHYFADADEVYQLAADMGGAGFVFSGDNDADIMHNSAQINLNVLESCCTHKVGRVFYSSSACIYPDFAQTDPARCSLKESMAYPANPDSEYGWEKLFSERLYQAYARNYGLNVRIARYHNVYGPMGTWRGGREKAPAAICRKVAEAPEGGTIEIWGDGEQTRSFLYVDDCVRGTIRLLRSDCEQVVNIGSEEMVSINELADLTMEIAGKRLEIEHIPGPLGVRGRNSDNTLVQERIAWRPLWELCEGIDRTYKWIESQVKQALDKTVSTT